MKTGIELITEERNRQINEEGWNSEHDDEHEFEELACAAAQYALPEIGRLYWHNNEKDRYEVLGWPFHHDWWKPSPDDRIKELAKAGALIAAEIDRLLRLENKF